MKPRDVVELLVLAAIWGASFMFMRIAVPAFGPAPVAGVRVVGAALMLVPIVIMRGEWPALRAHAGAIATVGIVGSALPFLLYGWAALALGAGVMSILNATTPLWGALIVWGWLGDRLNARRTAGLVIGFCGVAWLAWDHATLKSDTQAVSPALAVAACLGATVCYGFVAAFTKKRLVGVPPMAVAAGSQLAAAIVMAVPALVLRPAATPSSAAWWSAVTLAVVCTGVAYLLYFRLIAHAGATNATTVTFLVPLFAVLWGTLLLGEPLTTAMVVACALILLGTGLATGWLAPRAKRVSAMPIGATANDTRADRSS